MDEQSLMRDMKQSIQDGLKQEMIPFGQAMAKEFQKVRDEFVKIQQIINANDASIIKLMLQVAALEIEVKKLKEGKR